VFEGVAVPSGEFEEVEVELIPEPESDTEHEQGKASPVTTLKGLQIADIEGEVVSIKTT